MKTIQPQWMNGDSNRKVKGNEIMRSGLIILLLITSFCSFSQQTNMVVDVSKPIADVQPTMWGIFFEDINFAADGGLYAELVKNRSFEFDMPLTGLD